MSESNDASIHDQSQFVDSSDDAFWASTSNALQLAQGDDSSHTAQVPRWS
jgi:hypothetical protein